MNASRGANEAFYDKEFVGSEKRHCVEGAKSAARKND